MSTIQLNYRQLFSVFYVIKRFCCITGIININFQKQNNAFQEKILIEHDIVNKFTLLNKELTRNSRSFMQHNSRSDPDVPIYHGRHFDSNLSANEPSNISLSNFLCQSNEFFHLHPRVTACSLSIPTNCLTQTSCAPNTSRAITLHSVRISVGVCRRCELLGDVGCWT